MLNEPIAQDTDAPAARWFRPPDRQTAAERMVVVLEPDIAQVFKTPERVQIILRGIAGVLAPQMPENSGH